MTDRQTAIAPTGLFIFQHR